MLSIWNTLHIILGVVIVFFIFFSKEHVADLLTLMVACPDTVY